MDIDTDLKSESTLSADEAPPSVSDEPMKVTEMSDEEYFRKFKPKLFTCQGDHDYCVMYEPTKNLFVDDFESEIQASVIHDYAKLLRDEREQQARFASEQRAKFFKSGSESPKKPVAPPTTTKNTMKKPSSSSSSSSSSSDSDSSCSCGSSCSCSSSSSDSDSDSDNNGKKAQNNAKKNNNKEKTPPPPPPEPVDPDSIMLESDLETDESETDEEFYDEHPQKSANQQLAEKRRQLMLQHSIDPTNAHGIIENSRSSTPSLPDEVSSLPKQEKKSKTKKRKKERKEKVPSLKLTIQKPKYPDVSETSKLEEVFQNAIQQAYDGLEQKTAAAAASTFESPEPTQVTETSYQAQVHTPYNPPIEVPVYHQTPVTPVATHKVSFIVQFPLPP